MCFQSNVMIMCLVSGFVDTRKNVHNSIIPQTANCVPDTEHKAWNC